MNSYSWVVRFVGNVVGVEGEFGIFWMIICLWFGVWYLGLGVVVWGVFGNIFG